MANSCVGYVIIEAFLVIFSFTIRSKLNGSIGSEYEVNKLRLIIDTFLISVFTDSVWALQEGGVIRLPNLLYGVSNAISLTSISFGCLLWSQFVNAKLVSGGIFKLRKHTGQLILPFAIVAAMNICSIFSGWIFYIDDNGAYQRGKFYIVQAICCYIYIIFPTIKSVISVFKVKNKDAKSEYATYASYLLPSLLAALFEYMVPSVPVLNMSIYVVINVLFVNIQDSQIYNDALTGMNNRRKMNMYIRDRLENVSERSPMKLFMIDIDKFKGINDTFGHIEGDKAIITVSKAIAITAGKFGGFAARYGGDEFCFILEDSRISEKDVKAFMRNTLDELMKNNEMYKLSISIGCHTCKDQSTEPAHIIRIADEALYLDKKRKST